MYSLFNDFSLDEPSSNDSCTGSQSNKKDDNLSKCESVKKDFPCKPEEDVFSKIPCSRDSSKSSNYSTSADGDENKNYSYANKKIPESDLYRKSSSFSYSDRKKYSKDPNELQDCSPHSTSQNSNVLNFRHRIECMTNDCLTQNMLERDRLWKLVQKGTVGSEVYKKRLDNFCDQQKEFDNFVNSLKVKFTVRNHSENDNYEKETVIKKIEIESEIFKQFFPAYGVKEQVFSEIMKNQVTIINADSAYCFNIALPLLLYNAYLDHSVIACESNDILTQVLKERLDSLFPSQRVSDDKFLQVLSVEQLLKLISDTNFNSKNSYCLICNIPLKRCLATDILLASLRDLLVNQKHSKLVLLLSKYEDTDKFHCFFSQKIGCSSLNVPDLILPVRTMWKSVVPSVDDNFIEDVVNTVISIHALDKAGDIIAFLPSVSDVESIYGNLDKEMHNYQINDLLLFCITEDFSVKEYLVKEEDFSSKRRVYLVTNGNEGIVIPSIKYVIDCGIQKENSFDSQNDIHTFESSFISRAIAKMRKELAGINNIGTCYRLYCKKSYKDTRPKEYAEIFCINPIHSFVKVFQHRPYTSEGIQFVESLPTDVQVTTCKLLEDYGIVDGNLCLTTLGENIVKLPFPTKHSLFILLALQKRCVYEAIVIVAFFTAETGIFMESEDADHQRSIDVIKLDFNVLDSDSLTYLNIFKMWKESGFKMLWCSNNHISHAALKSIRLKVIEMCHIMRDCLQEEIEEDFSDQNDPNYLIEILHLSFGNNLCVFTGHHRIGYQILATHQLALLHPSSFLFSKEEYPRFLIYHKLIGGKQNFISNLTCIPLDFLLKFKQNGTLKFSESDCFEDKLEKRVIEPVGEKVISQVLLKNDGRRVRELEDVIKKDIGAKIVVIEPILGKGCVVVYAFPCDIYNCFTVLQEMLKNQTQALLDEEETKVIELKKGVNIIPVEIKWIKGAKTESFKHVLMGCQAASNRTFQDDTEIVAESTPSSAINYSLKLSWPRRTCTGEGFLNLKSRKDFSKARMLACTYIKTAENEVFLEVSRFKENQLVISEIARDVTKNDLVDSFVHLLPKCEFEVELCYSPPFETLAEELQQMKRQIEENCRKHSNIVNFEVRVLTPKPSSHFMEASVSVFEERSLDIEAKNISERKVNKMKVSCKPLYFSNMKCSCGIFKALSNYFRDELARFDNELEKHKSSFYKVIPTKDIASEDINIELSSNDIALMKALQLRINQLLDGVKLDKTNLESIHKLFCHGGHVFLKTLEKTKNVYILENFETKTIRLYGSPENCDYVKQCICDFLKDTVNEVGNTVTLSSDKQNRKILKEIIQTYGVNLESFVELFGLRSAALDIKSNSLKLCGKKENVQKAEEHVKELSAGINPADMCNDSSSGEICALCGLPAENLTFRLELCGHLYCSGCIESLVEQATLPLQCANCSADIILGDIRHVLDEDEVKIKDLVDKSMKDFFERNHDNIFHCPAPDCTFFLSKSDLKEQEKWKCPLCQNFICIECGVVFHEGLSCKMYKGTQKDPDYSLKVWQTSIGAHNCPFCKTPIEKTTGCNNMFCTKCSNHFCWLCGQGYKEDDDTYRHINQVHPGQLFT